MRIIAIRTIVLASDSEKPPVLRTAQVLTASTFEEWPKAKQDAYIKRHPGSKYAKNATKVEPEKPKKKSPIKRAINDPAQNKADKAKLGRVPRPTAKPGTAEKGKVDKVRVKE